MLYAFRRRKIFETVKNAVMVGKGRVEDHLIDSALLDLESNEPESALELVVSSLLECEKKLSPGEYEVLKKGWLLVFETDVVILPLGD